jgi:amino acid adenylation domain-containing protein
MTDASGLAYVIYTSGSTGVPKGVMVTHANVASLFTACEPWFRFGAEDVWTLFHSFAFDFSVWELWGALVHGGRVVIVPRRVAQSPQDFYALLCEQRVTVLNQTPSAFLQLMRAQAESGRSHTLRYVIFGGEALDMSALKPWFARNDPLAPQLINMYGITETTVHVTYRPIRAQDTEVLGPSPIGVPIAGLRAYVLDPCGAPVPIGVAGELYVAGNGLARGYLNRPDLTAERFVPDPFCQRPGERMYKSGDLARLRADGILEYLGRNDHQVKIRGFRIELGEIEARLLGVAGVREGRVVAREFGPGDRRLVSYYASDVPLSLPALRDALSASLPEHMVPAAYVRVDVFPLTVNGKLDVARLPAPDAGAFVSRDWEAPEGDVEVLLATIWGELLGLERVGRRDNFFELGGHSFLAIRLIERMREAGFGVDVRAVFAAPTLQALAAQAMPGRLLEVPPNRIPAGCTTITPDMVTLVDLREEEIAAIVRAAPGGAANIQDIYPLAPLQEGILFLHLMREEAGDYLWTAMLSFDARDKLDQFLGALQVLIDRHDILRTAMHWDGLAEPVQVVYRSARLRVEELSLRAEEGSVDAQMMERHGLRGYWLDVTRPPLLRAFIAHDPVNECWRLQIVLHHLISDHRAINILIEEVHAILHGQPLAPVPPFRNLVAQARLGVRREEHEAFFRDMLSHVDEPTAPFGLLNVPEARTDIRHSGKIRLPTALGERLRRQARELKVSVASLFHVAWARLLSSAAGRDEVVFGTFMFGRLQGGAGADRMPGMFINILPICMRTGGLGVADAAREAHALLTQLLRHEHAPLPLALRCSGVQPPKLLFSAVLNYRHGDYVATGEQLDLEMDMQQVDERNHYPLTLMVDDMGDGFLLNACTSAAIDPHRVCDYTESVLEHLVDALENAAQMPLLALDVLPPEERALMAKWSAVGVPHGCELIHRRIAAHARRMPEQIAVEHQGQRLSYAELDARAERLAGYLRAQGVGPEVQVGICVERSIHMIVGLLAILKAGGAYVPLDPAYPQERLAYIVKDSAPAMVLAMPATAQAARSIAGDLRVIDLAADVPRSGAGRRADAQPQENLPQHVAYAIYTSGSTGVPKGVQVTHGNLASYVDAAVAAYALQSSDRVLQFSSLNFDLSVEEIFATLGGGATLVLAPWSRLPSIAEFQRTVDSAQLTMLSLPTAYWHEWAAELRGIDALAARSLRLVVVGGERVLEPRYREWHAAVGDGVEWINTYGPTEATVIATLARASGSSPSHIGRPIAGTTAYILDARNLPVPPGAPGELCIGGAQIARGYRNRPDLTAERFVPDPIDPTPGARMYRTGDRARYRDDGTIEYLGRFDDQVKLRGFRVEPEEIRAVLARLPWVREAVVTVCAGADHQSRLVAYVVPQPGAQMPPLREVRDAMARTLPTYMMPAHVVGVPRIPLTPNGKIDRKSLLAPEGDVDDTGYVAARTQIEELLCGLWSEALNVKRVGVHDSFFDLGGHSLIALQVMSRLGRRLEREVPVHLLFANPTVAALARRISELDTAEAFRNRVTVRKSGNGVPLFIIHAGDGEVGYAFDLAPHVPEQHPLYALAAIGFAEGETPLSTVQAMATSYLRAIRSVQPYGPYQVLGWSAGGMIAYEIAAQLLAAGESVAFVGVIDTLSDYASILGRRGEGPTEAQFFASFARDQFGDELADQLTAYVGRDDIDAMLDLCRRHGAIDAAINSATLRRHLAVRHAIALALGRYRPQPIAVPLAVYTAAGENRPDPRLGWDAIAEHGLDVVELPGTHWSIVEPAHIGSLGAAISRALAARARGGVEDRDEQRALSDL